jgi:hypothetical protein
LAVAIEADDVEGLRSERRHVATRKRCRAGVQDSLDSRWKHGDTTVWSSIHTRKHWVTPVGYALQRGMEAALWAVWRLPG